MNKIKKVFHSPKLILAYLLRIECVARLFSDQRHIIWTYWCRVGKINIENPITFGQKIQWLKLYNRDPAFTKMVDKYEVKKYVAELIGDNYIIPTIGVYDTYEDIDFNVLPEKFVIKCTHDSGGVIICSNKKKFNHKKYSRIINKSLKLNYFYKSREWPYKDVKPRIIIEEYMKDNQNVELVDYKFFCFNGEPLYCQVIQNRRTKETIDFFDMDWIHQEFVGLNPDVTCAKTPPQKPSTFEEMKRIVRVLAKDIPFVRIDVYEINNHVYFGEITFFPASGYGSFSPLEWNERMGELIKLPKGN